MLDGKTMVIVLSCVSAAGALLAVCCFYFVCCGRRRRAGVSAVSWLGSSMAGFTRAFIISLAVSQQLQPAAAICHSQRAPTK
jgi:hypothetical protein